MSNLGIVEGFFGPAWSQEARLSFPDFLNQYGGNFYLYAPKRDALLRKEWRSVWGEDYLRELSILKDAFQSKGIKFGVALSPFGLGDRPSPSDLSLLRQKIKQLEELEIDQLGLFFDDMPSTANLLSNQSNVVKLALESFPEGLIFCPSYYTFDPILDKVFGERPPGYMEGLAQAIPWGVEIFWTGPKVISEEISASHLSEVTELLGRKPFIWENLYANDGPRNCKFLKLKYMTGRDSSILDAVSGMGFNLMNQPYLSQIAYLSSLYVLREGYRPAQAFEESCRSLLTDELSDILLSFREEFLLRGLDNMDGANKKSLDKKLETHFDGAAYEIRAWLRGEYLVGPECLTD